MIRRILYLQFFLFVSFVVAGQQNAEALRRVLLDASSPKVLVASHRATHHVYPENSLMAIEESIKLGVDIIEIDVKVSKDGIPFLMHDRTMNRTTTGKGDPEEFTWAELSQLDIVDKGKQTTYKIPTLEDALILAKGKILVDLDLKTDRIEKIVEVVNRTGTKEIVFFFDSDYNTLARIQALGKDYMIMPRAYSVAQADSAIMLFNPPVVHIDFSFYTPECVQLIQSKNARIWINALGEPDRDIRSGQVNEALQNLLIHGANIIQTDEPELLLKALNEKGYRKSITPRKDGVLPMISTHRGASRLAPENTLASFAKAIELNADFIEIDVRTASDGAQVIMHDGSLKRTTGLDAKVEKVTLAEIRKLSAGSWFSTKYKREKVPTLKEVCELVVKENKNKSHSTKLYVDCKEINAAEVVQTLNQYALLDSAVFYGDVNVLAEIKKLHSRARVMPSYPGKEQMEQVIREIAPYAVDVDYNKLNAETVAFCHARGIKVFSDLLGEYDLPEEYRKAIQLNIDLIQTDNISSVLQVYNEF